MDPTPTATVQGAEPLPASSAGSVSASIRDRADPRLVLADRVEQLYSQMWLGILMRSEEHTSELQSPLNISYAVFCLKKKK